MRALGKTVIEINVDDGELEDRIDEAVQYFQQFHSDGIRRTYLKYKLTSVTKTRLSGLNQLAKWISDRFKRHFGINNLVWR